MKSLFLFSSVLAIAAGVAPNPNDPQYQGTGDQKRTYIFPETGESVAYHLYVPTKWTKNAKLPLVIVLHGANQGPDTPFQRGDGVLGKAAEDRGYIVAAVTGYRSNADFNNPFPLVPATPSAPAANGKAKAGPAPPTAEERERSEQDVLYVADLVAAEYNADPARVYLMGNSTGGGGTWYLGQKYPERWAAISPSAAPAAPTHLGWAIIKTNQIGKDTYTKENLIDHLRRVAYYGVAADQNMGTDPGDIPFEVRATPIPNAALFRTAGRGMALPNAGPGANYWRPVAYGVTTEAEARKAVDELAAKKVDLVKFWVDDRNGTVPKLPPALYKAIIDEAHKRNLRAVAHIFDLANAKELLRSGIDGFMHMVRDKDVDDEFIQLLKAHPNVFVTPNLPDRETTAEDFKLMGETVPAEEVQRERDVLAKRTPEAVKQAREFYALQARNLAKYNAAGVRIALGTDSGTSVGWTVHQELTDMVAAGMTPAQVITAATKTAAGVVRIDQLGTIAAGKSANFLVLDANPLDNINNTRRISKVYQRGKELDRAAMRAEFMSR